MTNGAHAYRSREREREEEKKMASNENVQCMRKLIYARDNNTHRTYDDDDGFDNGSDDDGHGKQNKSTKI